MGATPLRYPLCFTEVKGAEPSGSLEVPVALTEVEGAEPGGSPEVPVALVEIEGAKPGGSPVALVMSGGVCCSSIWIRSSLENVIVEFVGEPPCEQFLYK